MRIGLFSILIFNVNKNVGTFFLKIQLFFSGHCLFDDINRIRKILNIFSDTSPLLHPGYMKVVTCNEKMLYLITNMIDITSMKLILKMYEGP
jgi:hypothetical protein